ncbi:hypothetical protein [Asticcacaulis sp. AND118]|uniref:hypothetical protein n=1 Tax=Asticcacaulis sp. AND118 TaxID=2840468 RepID=UPI001CFFAE36|nr:hypothetical protein [Asticcacaulis sp. AND118]UDF04143.1 hypothetical protein LH365_03620 [Asticcacaulis sp. AND118]
MCQRRHAARRHSCKGLICLASNRIIPDVAWGIHALGGDMPDRDALDAKTARVRPAGGAKAFWLPFFDGTILDAFFYKAENEDRLRGLYREFNGFHELEQRETKTKRIEAYADILRDDETRRNLEEKMNMYFNDTVEMFPYARRNLSRDKGVTDLRIFNPDAYFKVVIAMIQRRFPGGTDGKIGDQDVRDMTTCLRVLYKEDLWNLIRRRRSDAWGRMWAGLLWMAFNAIIFPLILELMPRLYPGIEPAIAIGCVGALTLLGLLSMVWGVFAHRDFLRQIRITYESALKTSASNLRNALHARLTESVSLISQIMARIDREKWDLKAEDRLKEWPDKVTHWSKLAFWLAARVEAMEEFIQAEMWLIRRTHFGLRHVAGLISFGLYATLVLLVAGLITLVVFILPQIGVGATTLWVTAASLLSLAVGNLLLGLATILNAQNYALPEIELQDILQMHLIMGHKDTKLHDEIAELIKREKISILHDEDLQKGPKPRT